MNQINNQNFLSIPNLKQNLSILQTYMLKEHNINLDELNIDLKKPIFEVMKKTYDENKTKSLKDLNYLSISTLRNNLLKQLEDNKKQMMNPNKSQGILGRMNEQPILLSKADNKDMTSLYNERTNLYNNNQQQHMVGNVLPIQQTTQVNDNDKKKLESIKTNGNNNDMMERLNEMQQNRENFENSIMNETSQKVVNFTNIQPNLDNIGSNSIQNPNNVLEKTEKNDINEIQHIPNIINKQFEDQPFNNNNNNKVNNKELSENQIMQNKMSYNQLQMQEIFSALPQIIRQQLQEITKEKGEIEELNSDFMKKRDDNEQQSSEKEVIGTNKQYNESQAKSHYNYINNDGKLIDKIINNINNNGNQNHDPRIDLSLQSFKLLNDPNINYTLYTRNILINSGDRNTQNYSKRCDFKISVNSSSTDTIQTRLKNIKSISIGSIIIPMPFNTHAAYDYLNNQDLNFYITNYYHHYLGLYIDNLDGEYDGTNDNISKNISNLIVDKTFYNQDGRNFIIFKPIQNDKKIYKTPLSSLSNMKIKLLTPNGMLINDYTDSSIVIKSIDLISSGALLKFTTLQKFTHNDLFRYDTIKFSGFNISYAHTTQVAGVNTNELDKLNTYLNRNIGHKIYNLGQGILTENNTANANTTDDIYKYTYQEFYIQSDITYTFLNQLQYINVPSLDATFINLTAQNVISIQTEYLEMENENYKHGLV